MNSLTPWEPLDGMMSLREALNRLFEDSVVGLGRFEPFGRSIPFDVRETDKDYVVEAALPGVTPDHIHITATTDSLTITARVSREEQTEEKAEQMTEQKAASAAAGKGKDGKDGAEQGARQEAGCLRAARALSGRDDTGDALPHPDRSHQGERDL